MGTALGRLTGWALVAALGTAALAGCSTEAQPEPAPTTSEAAEVFGSDEEALAAAEEAYREYVRISNEVTAGDGDVTSLRSVLAEGFYSDVAGAVESAAAEGIRTSGETELSGFTLQSRDGDALRFYVCSDVSEVRIFDGDGTDITPTDRAGITTFLIGADLSNGDVALVASETWDVGTCVTP